MKEPCGNVKFYLYSRYLQMPSASLFRLLDLYMFWVFYLFLLTWHTLQCQIAYWYPQKLLRHITSCVSDLHSFTLIQCLFSSTLYKSLKWIVIHFELNASLWKIQLPIEILFNFRFGYWSLHWVLLQNWFAFICTSRISSLSKISLLEKVDYASHIL